MSTPPIPLRWNGETFEPVSRRFAAMADKHRGCSIEGCGRKHLALGYCRSHYERRRRHGDARAQKKALNGSTTDFVSFAATFQGDECLIWPFGRDGAGYGKCTTKDGARMVASRAVCMAAHGEPPSTAHHAARSCGNGHLGCVNQRHLRWATPAENSADRNIHGTANKGERHGISRLREDDVRKIRELAASGIVQTDIADMFAVSQTAISNIHHRKRWGWLEDKT